MQRVFVKAPCSSFFEDYLSKGERVALGVDCDIPIPFNFTRSSLRKV